MLELQVKMPVTILGNCCCCYNAINAKKRRTTFANKRFEGYATINGSEYFPEEFMNVREKIGKGQKEVD